MKPIDKLLFKPRKICMICQKWESGGIESFVANLIFALDLSDYQIDIVVESFSKNELSHRLTSIGIRFIELSGNVRDLHENIRLFSNLLQEKHYDVVHLHCYQAVSLYYLKKAFDAGISIRIAHSHNNDLRKSFMKPIKLLVHRFAKKLWWSYATISCACSSQAGNFMFDSTDKVISNGIDLEKFRFSLESRRNIRQTHEIDNRFVIGHMGRFCHQKNQIFLLHLLKKVVEHEESALLLLIGEGEMGQDIRTEIKRLHLEDHVLLLGWTDRPEDYYSVMDVFIFPSVFEAFGLVALEAQCNGLPVLMSDVVPHEVALTHKVERLSLHNGTPQKVENLLEVWADKLIKLHRPQDRDTLIIEDQQRLNRMSITFMVEQIEILYQ